MFVLCTMCPPVLLQLVAAKLASAALAELSDNKQSAMIRKKLIAFKWASLRDSFRGTLGILLAVVAVLLHRYLYALAVLQMTLILSPSLLPNVTRIAHNIRPHKRHRARQQIVQVVPGSSTSSTKAIDQWESEGQASADPYETNLPEDLRAMGVLGVSLALLKALDEEKDIPSDWTMAEVCAEVVKPQTLFNHPEQTSSSQHPQVHCSYAALIGKACDSSGRKFVGRATHFVSYAW